MAVLTQLAEPPVKAAASKRNVFTRPYSLEITSRKPEAIKACKALLPQGTHVYIASIPGDSYHSTIRTAAELTAAGFVPVPHVVARNLLSFTQFNDFLARLAGEAGVQRALVVGGDAEHPAGPFTSALQLLQTGAFQKHSLRRVGIACYAEPNRRVEPARLEKALVEKLEFLAREDFEPWLMSQFCFDAGLILAMVRKLRGADIALPLHVGLAGPADARTLWKYALHCGIGNSMRALGTHVDAISNLMVRHSPADIITRLAEAQAREPGLGIEGVHLFAFGDVEGSANWANAHLASA